MAIISFFQREYHPDTDTVSIPTITKEEIEQQIEYKKAEMALAQSMASSAGSLSGSLTGASTWYYPGTTSTAGGLGSPGPAPTYAPIGPAYAPAISSWEQERSVTETKFKQLQTHVIELTEMVKLMQEEIAYLRKQRAA